MRVDMNVESPYLPDSESASKKPKRDRKHSRRSESASSRSGSSGESGSDGEGKSKKKIESAIKKAAGSASPVSSAPSSPLQLKPPPAPPIIGPVFEEKPATQQPLRITIVNKPAATSTPVPVETTAFKMHLDSDDPPKRIIRPVRTPTPSREDLFMEKPSEADKAKVAAAVVPDPAETGGWRTVNSDGSTTKLTESRPPSDIADHTAPPTPSLVTPVLATPLQAAPVVDQQAASSVQPPSSSITVRAATETTESLIPARLGGPAPPPKQRGSSFGVPAPPPPLSMASAPKASKYPETAKIMTGIKFIQDRVLTSIKAETQGSLRLSDLSTSMSDSQAKTEQREKLLTSLTDFQKERFELKRRQLETAYKNDCETYGVVTRAFLAEDSSMEQSLRTALSSALENLERQLLSKLDLFLDNLINGL